MAKYDIIENETLFQMLERQTASYGDKIGMCDLDERLTYREFRDRALRLAGGLVGLGLKKGDRILVQMPNCLNMTVLWYACFRLGVVPINLVPSYRLNDIIPLATRIAPAAWIGPNVFMGFDFPATAREVAAICPSMRTLICMEAGVEGTVSLGDLLAHEPVAADVP